VFHRERLVHGSDEGRGGPHAVALSLTGRSVKAYVYSLQQRYADAAREYEALVRADRSNRTWLLNLSHCHVRRSDLARAAAVLEEAIPVFPADIALRHRLAQLVRSTYGTERSIPYLSSAMSIYPMMPESSTSLAPPTRDWKEKACAHYLRRTLSADPKNFKARQYLDLIEGGRDESASTFSVMTPLCLQKRRRLMRRTGRTAPRRVRLSRVSRRIIRAVGEAYIQDQRGERDRRSLAPVHYIQSLDRSPRGASCTVINNGTRIDVPEYHTQSLSDPESRLYYDLKARIYTLPSLRRGSIVDFVSG
jgi:tetratricopeptide (TPR) repeat protein